MTQQDIRFGIIGAGVAGGFHATAIERTPGARLVAVCAARPDLAVELATAYHAEVAEDMAALLARDDIDAVSICTPSGQHAEHGIAAARAGKHVLVEKPMALSLADADALIDACRESGVQLGVALQRRTDPNFRAAHDAIAGGALGRMVLGMITVPYLRPQSYYDSAAWRGTWALDGGGALMNQGVHLVDLLIWLMGDDVIEVQARSDTLAHTIEVEDVVTAALRFKSGALGTIAATTAAAPGFPHRVEVYGTSGGLQIEGEAVVRWESVAADAPAGPQVTVSGSGSQSAGPGADPKNINMSGHAWIIENFVAALRAGTPPLVSGEDARRALAVVLAVYQSAREGRAVSLDVRNQQV